LNTKSDHSSDIKVDLVEQDIPKVVNRKYANLVFHLDSVVMKNVNDLNQLSKDSFYSIGLPAMNSSFGMHGRIRY
jgi:hypothetical protein